MRLTMDELFHIVVAMAKGLAAWFVPFAVAAYVVTYFVMAIIFVMFWKQEQAPPWMNRFWRKIGNGENPKN